MARPRNPQDVFEHEVGFRRSIRAAVADLSPDQVSEMLERISDYAQNQLAEAIADDE